MIAEISIWLMLAVTLCHSSNCMPCAHAPSIAAMVRSNFPAFADV
ncbi:MAG: hypothetical protein A07HN63_00473 [uncultured archaeon A07HN63]|nr:MAG: hypothetical protein A07HN63_00473 [uncultured archaeon A07HN63]